MLGKSCKTEAELRRGVKCCPKCYSATNRDGEAPYVSNVDYKCFYCRRPLGKTFYCEDCRTILKNGAKRYRIGGGVVEIWIKAGSPQKATLNGHECIVEYVGTEVLE